MLKVGIIAEDVLVVQTQQLVAPAYARLGLVEPYVVVCQVVAAVEVETQAVA